MLSFDLLWHMNLWRIIRMLLQLSPILKLFIADVAPEQKKIIIHHYSLKKKVNFVDRSMPFCFAFFVLLYFLLLQCITKFRVLTNP